MILNSFLCSVHYCSAVEQDLNYREAQGWFYFLTTFVLPERGFKPTEALIGWDSYRNQLQVGFIVWSHVLFFLSESEINQIQFFSFIMADWADSRGCCVFVVSGSSRCLLGFVVGFYCRYSSRWTDWLSWGSWSFTTACCGDASEQFILPVSASVQLLRQNKLKSCSRQFFSHSTGLNVFYPSAKVKISWNEWNGTRDRIIPWEFEPWGGLRDVQ